jgi:hypothetical protein
VWFGLVCSDPLLLPFIFHFFLLILVMQSIERARNSIELFLALAKLDTDDIEWTASVLLAEIRDVIMDLTLPDQSDHSTNPWVRAILRRSFDTVELLYPMILHPPHLVGKMGYTEEFHHILIGGSMASLRYFMDLDQRIDYSIPDARGEYTMNILTPYLKRLVYPAITRIANEHNSRGFPLLTSYGKPDDFYWRYLADGLSPFFKTIVPPDHLHQEFEVEAPTCVWANNGKDRVPVSEAVAANIPDEYVLMRLTQVKRGSQPSNDSFSKYELILDHTHPRIFPAQSIPIDVPLLVEFIQLITSRPFRKPMALREFQAAIRMIVCFEIEELYDWANNLLNEETHVRSPSHMEKIYALKFAANKNRVKCFKYWLNALSFRLSQSQRQDLITESVKNLDNDDTIILDQLLAMPNTPPSVDAFRMAAMHGHGGVLQKLFDAVKHPIPTNPRYIDVVVTHVVSVLSRNGYSALLASMLAQFQQAGWSLNSLKSCISYAGETVCSESLALLRPWMNADRSSMIVRSLEYNFEEKTPEHVVYGMVHTMVDDLSQKEIKRLYRMEYVSKSIKRWSSVNAYFRSLADLPPIEPSPLALIDLSPETVGSKRERMEDVNVPTRVLSVKRNKVDEAKTNKKVKRLPWMRLSTVYDDNVPLGAKRRKIMSATQRNSLWTQVKQE